MKSKKKGRPVGETDNEREIARLTSLVTGHTLQIASLEAALESAGIPFDKPDKPYVVEHTDTPIFEPLDEK